MYGQLFCPLYIYTHTHIYRYRYNIDRYPRIFLSLDKNECLENENLCEHGSCVNTVGSYMCNCASGFQSEETKTKCIGMSKFIIVFEA